MGKRTLLTAAAALAAGALLGWLAASGPPPNAIAQDQRAGADPPPNVLPIPEPPFRGKIGRTAKDSTPDFPRQVETPRGRRTSS